MKDFPRGINSFHGHGVPRDAMNVATAMLRGAGFQPATNWVRPFMAGYTRPAMYLTSANVSQTFNQPRSENDPIWPGENLPHESCSKSFTALPFGAKSQGPTTLAWIFHKLRRERPRSAVAARQAVILMRNILFIREHVKIMIGGAPITQGYADEIGADGYARDAASGVDVAKQLLELSPA